MLKHAPIAKPCVWSLGRPPCLETGLCGFTENKAGVHRNNPPPTPHEEGSVAVSWLVTKRNINQLSSTRFSVLLLYLVIFFLKKPATKWLTGASKVKTNSCCPWATTQHQLSEDAHILNFFVEKIQMGKNVFWFWNISSWFILLLNYSIIILTLTYCNGLWFFNETRTKQSEGRDGTPRASTKNSLSKEMRMVEKARAEMANVEE